MTIWFAHSHPDLPIERWHALREHLIAVGEQSAMAARKFGSEEMGRAAGQLHDLGKYSEAFQQRLRGGGGRVDHSTAGARVAAERFGLLGQLIACAVAGHHAGLANGAEAGERTPLQDRLGPSFGAHLPPLADVWREEITLPESLGSAGPLRGLHPDKKIAPKRDGFRIAFFARMLFSCLVDADYLDTEAWYAGVGGRHVERGAWPSISTLKAALDQHLADKSAQATPSEINSLRAEVLCAARTAAEWSPGLFSLTVPTGGGKTLSGLAFALDHAARWNLDRVIYVAPFTSVIGSFCERLPRVGKLVECSSPT